MGAKSVRVAGLCICEGQSTKRSPQKRAVCLRSLGPVKRDNWWCFHYKVWGNVGVGAQYECVCICVCVYVCVVGVGRLTQLPPLWHHEIQRLVRTSCYSLNALLWEHKRNHMHKHSQRLTNTWPKAKSIPRDKLFKANKMLKIRITCSPVFLCHSVSSQCHAGPLADLSVCLSSLRTSLKSLMQWRLRFWLPLRLN